MDHYLYPMGYVLSKDTFRELHQLNLTFTRHCKHLTQSEQSSGILPKLFFLYFQLVKQESKKLEWPKIFRHQFNLLNRIFNQLKSLNMIFYLSSYSNDITSYSNILYYNLPCIYLYIIELSHGCYFILSLTDCYIGQL